MAFFVGTNFKMVVAIIATSAFISEKGYVGEANTNASTFSTLSAQLPRFKYIRLKLTFCAERNKFILSYQRKLPKS